jgi:hypothetical protein
MDIALVTCAVLPEPDPDAAPLAAALDAAGLCWALRAWDDADVDWSAAAVTVLRSAWNYPQRPDDFRAWVGAAARVTRLCNPAEVVSHSLHKSYLLALAERGVPVTPTALVPRGSAAALAAICGEYGFADVVIKPAVSAASFATRRFPLPMAAAGERHLRALAAQRDVLVQPYLPSVETYGERALIWIDGEVTHAVRKSPRFEGDAESVSQEPMAITAAERALAERAIAAFAEAFAAESGGAPLLYARVDMAPGPDGDPVVMELELIEPSLFFNQCPEALARFVAGLRERL